MRRPLGLLLLVIALLPGLVLAQQNQSGQAPPPAPAKKSSPAPKAEKQEPAKTQSAEQQASDDLQYNHPSSVAPKPAKSPQAPTAPKPGHPLDPADVDVLTGKNKPQQNYGYGYVLADPYVYGYYNRSMFTNPGGPGSSFTNPGGNYGRVAPLPIGPGFAGGGIGNFLRPGFRFF